MKTGDMNIEVFLRCTKEVSESEVPLDLDFWGSEFLLPWVKLESKF